MNGKHARPKPPTYSKRVAAAAALSMGAAGAAAMAAPVAHAEDMDSTQTIPVVSVADHEAPEMCATPDYIVQHGDNLSQIAADYGVSLDEMEGLNPGIIAGARPDDYSLIYAGGHVHLPEHPCSTGHGSARHGKGHHVTWYASCHDAPWGLHRGESGYRHALDMDGDGKACEGPWPPKQAPPATNPPTTTPTQPTSPPTTTPPTSTGSGNLAKDANGMYIPVISPDGPGTNSGYVAHSPDFWRPLIEQAEAIVPLYGGDQTDSIVQRILIESSGDPNAINLWDSNAANGDPSRGLMQTIGATFNTWHVDGTSSNIYNPLANLTAALNYINDVYGGVVPLGSTY